MVIEDFKILVVEDERLQAIWMRHVIGAIGYPVQIASDGVEAMERLQEDEYSIVMTDLMMPSLNGIELCRAIRAHPFDHYIYVIMVTGKEEKSDLIQGIEAGADDYMVKPVDESELFARLKTAKRILNMERTLRQQYEEISLLSATDPLTGVANRRAFTEHLPKEMARCARYGRDLSIILTDIDRFKQVNDTHGHLEGDRVLQQFACCLAAGIREGVDSVARFGGEEFIIVLPETDGLKAMACARRLRRQVARMAFASEAGSFSITASFGVVTVAGQRDSPQPILDTLLKAADDNLFLAKGQGRNRCVFSQI